VPPARLVDDRHARASGPSPNLQPVTSRRNPWAQSSSRSRLRPLRSRRGSPVPPLPAPPHSRGRASLPRSAWVATCCASSVPQSDRVRSGRANPTREEAL